MRMKCEFRLQQTSKRAEPFKAAAVQNGADNVIIARTYLVALAIGCFVVGAGWLRLATALHSENPMNQKALSAAKQKNHLDGSTSPYLLQHVHNPVDWYPWGREALQKARK